MTIDSSAWTYRRNAILADFLKPHDIITALVKTVRCAFVFVACSPVCYSDIARQLELYTSAYDLWILTGIQLSDETSIHLVRMCFVTVWYEHVYSSRSCVSCQS